MTVNGSELLWVAVTLLPTYLFHSTLLLGLTWLALRRRKAQSQVLSGWLWKAAAVIGLVTAPLQLLSGFSDPIVRYSLAFQSAVVATEDSERPLVDHALDDSGGTRLDVSADVRIRSKERVEPTRLIQNMAEVGASANSNHPTSDSEAEFGQAFPASVEMESLVSSANDLSADELPSTSAMESEFAASRGRFGRKSSPAVSWFPGVVYACFILFLIGGLLRLIWQSCFFHSRLRRCDVIENGMCRSILDELLRRSAVRRSVTLLSSEKYPEPVAFGLLRWRIALPAGIERKLSRDELRALLAHELAHLVRGDTFWLCIGRVLCSCFAFQPLNFMARREWQQAAEYQCDDWAVRHAVNAFSLARCLTLVAEWRLNRPLCSATLAASGSKSNLTDRIERLVSSDDRHDPWTSRFRRKLLIGAAVLAALVLIYWGPQMTLLARSAIEENEQSPAVEIVVDDGGPMASDEEYARSIAKEMESVQHELRLLERDMEQLNQLLATKESRPEVRRLAERLRLQMERLAERRDFLSNLLNQFEKEFEL